MGRSQETFNKKELQKRKEKKRKAKENRRQEKKESGEKQSLDDMIAYVDENGVITSTPSDPSERSEVVAEDIEVSVPPADASGKMDKTRNGTLHSFNDSRGFGFIRDASTGDRIFVHMNNMEGNISEGSKVSYEIGKGQKGPEALKVKKI